jgi:hypothetical protein
VLHATWHNPDISGSVLKDSGLSPILPILPDSCGIVESLISFFSQRRDQDELYFCSENYTDFGLELKEKEYSLHPSIKYDLPRSQGFIDLETMVNFIKEKKKIRELSAKEEKAALEREIAKQAAKAAKLEQLQREARDAIAQYSAIKAQEAAYRDRAAQLKAEPAAAEDYVAGRNYQEDYLDRIKAQAAEYEAILAELRAEAAHIEQDMARVRELAKAYGPELHPEETAPKEQAKKPPRPSKER